MLPDLPDDADIGHLVDRALKAEEQPRAAGKVEKIIIQRLESRRVGRSFGNQQDQQRQQEKAACRHADPQRQPVPFQGEQAAGQNAEEQRIDRAAPGNGVKQIVHEIPP